MNADRHAFGTHACGNRHRRYASQVGTDREQIFEIHLHRVIDLFADTKRRRWRGWSDDHVDLCEQLTIVFVNQSSYLSGFAIVRVVVT